MIGREDLVGFVQNYFDAFCEADDATLGRILHEDVHLRDWATDITGRDEVVKAMTGIVNSFAKVEIEVVDMSIDVYGKSNGTHRECHVAARINITLGSETIKVLDLITLKVDGGDGDGGITPITIQITQIDAYQQ